jgi:hypothetical protein
MSNEQELRTNALHLLIDVLNPEPKIGVNQCKIDKHQRVLRMQLNSMQLSNPRSRSEIQHTALEA